MSDQSQGPGWWLASDGKWYPPDQAPAVPPPETWATPPTGPPPSSGMPTAAKVALAVVGGLATLIALSVLAISLLGEESESRFQSTTAIGGDDDDDGADGAPAEAPAGYVLIDGDGVSIAVPDGWQEISPEDFAMTQEEFEAAFPEAPPELIEQASGAFEQGATLLAFDMEDPEFSSNVNIASFPGEAPISLLESQASKQLEALGGSVVSSDRVSVPAGDALRIEYTLDVAAPDGSAVTATGVQFYVPADGRTHVITISGIEDVGTISDTMVDTFRVD